MSRVNDALRRVANGGVAAEGPADTASSLEDQWRLDHYPPEQVIAPPEQVIAPPEQVMADQPAAGPRAVEEARGPVRPAPAGRSRSAQPLHSPSLVRAKLVGSGLPSPLVVEQYRRLAASLHDLQVEHGLKVVMVTSALPQEGKTFTVVNLALTLTDSYRRRVLLIDADMRRPAVHEVLGVQNAAGLGEALQSSSLELPVNEVSPLLSVITAGRPMSSPLAGLSSPRLREILDACSSRFDWVLLDAPPVGLLPDGQLLARTVGAVLLVIRAGSTPHAHVERAIAELGRDCIVGTVLNGADEHDIPSANVYDYYR